jgi:hypothetical protein
MKCSEVAALNDLATKHGPQPQVQHCTHSVSSSLQVAPDYLEDLFELNALAVPVRPLNQLQFTEEKTI